MKSKQKSLLDTTSQFKPHPKITAPVVWVRRLVLIEELTEDAKPIREIEFRRGLNIIATKKAGKDIRTSVGHNVGKTLLTSFIRYCLGEQTFAREHDRATIANKFPDGFVLAEVFVDEQLWTIARPFATDSESPSMAHEGIGWRQAISAEEYTPFAEFIETIESQTTDLFSEVLLPGPKRHANWKDLLAWLTRDQHCAYNNPLQWRSRWTESGSPELDIENASLLVRLAMDLVDDQEGDLIERRKVVLGRKREAIEEHREKSASLERTREFLIERLKVNEEQLADTLFAQSSARKTEQEIQNVLQEIEATRNEFGLDDLNAKVIQARETVKSLENLIESKQDDRAFEESQIPEADDDAEIPASFSRLFKGCPIKDTTCSRHTEDQKERERDAYRKIRELEASVRISRLDREIAELNAELKKQKKELKRIEKERLSVQKNADKKLRDPQRRLATLEAIKKEVEEFGSSLRSVNRLKKRIDRLDAEAERLREDQRKRAIRNSAKLRKLNDSFRFVQTELLGKEPDQSIKIEVNRLAVFADSSQPSLGEGMATSATMSLDLACLRASLTNMGHHPRFLIHDSPRGGDLEPHLYANLFEFAVNLEAIVNGEPPFQYIITTTTPPPRVASNKTYIRETLHSLTDDGLLLKTQIGSG